MTCVVYGIEGKTYARQEGVEISPSLRIETTGGIWKYLAWAFGAGLGSGLLGIGGGMILGPLLLDLGVNPRVSAPVTHYMVLFTSSMTVIQFAILGQLLPGHTAWFGSLCLVWSYLVLEIELLRGWGRGRGGGNLRHSGHRGRGKG